MPRETIDTRNPKCIARVGWSSDPETATNVQVAIGVPDLAIAGSPYKDVWVHLDLAQTNRLIRTLRKARDATFGADA